MARPSALRFETFQAQGFVSAFVGFTLRPHRRALPAVSR
jgi:hypothetical protein